MEDVETGSQYLARAIDFVNSTKVLCERRNQGWLPSACLLVGTAMELISKKQLLEGGVTVKALRSPPYSHDLDALWKQHTSLYAEATQINAQLANESDYPASFDLAVHFKALAKGYSKTGDYSLRYHNGERSFADPCILGQITERIAARERMRTNAP